MVNKGYVLDRYRWELYAMLKKAGHDAAAQRERTLLRHNSTVRKSPWQVVHFSEDGESVLLKRMFDTPFDHEEWQDFCDNTWVEICSPYDCTGKMFSVSLDAYTLKDGRTWVYHTMALDV